MVASQAPESVQVIYQQIGELHIFTSPDLPGLSVTSPDVKTAYGRLAGVVTQLVRFEHGGDTTYFPEESFEEFLAEQAEENLLVNEFRMRAAHAA